jgi:polyphenol oxidase
LSNIILCAVANTSRLFDVPHGFTNRAGGVSQGPYASLNLGLNTEDARAVVLENLGRAAAAAGFGGEQLTLVNQVHGDRVVQAPAPQSAFVLPATDADAVWTQQRGQAVGVTVADCVPLLLLDVRTRRVAAVHAGWKGAVARIAQKTVAAWVAAGSQPADVRAAIGPCIRPCCYEVSDDLYQRFAGEFGAQAGLKKGARWHLDLPFAVRSALIAAGVPEGQIDADFACTACTPEHFFSHRRDRGVTGRQMGYIVCGG